MNLDLTTTWIFQWAFRELW